MTSVAIGQQTIVLTQAILLDVSVAVIYLEQDAFSLMQQTEAVQNLCSQNSTGDYVCYCGQDKINQFPNLTFLLNNGGGFSILPQDYLINIGSNYCYFGILPATNMENMIFGDIFFQNFFIAFDKINQQIGIAHNIAPTLYNLSNYTYPLPTDFAGSNQYTTIVLLGTNDIHGHISPSYYTSPLQNQTIDGQYGVGGTILLGTYIKQLMKTWQDSLIWLVINYHQILQQDAGDQFTGTLESQLFNGAPITVFYENNGLTGSAIGNHEFDNGLQSLENLIANSTFPWLAANLYNASTMQFANWTNLFQTWNGTVGGVKVGVIGLISTETPITSATNLSSLDFQPYTNITIQLAQQLRNEGCEIIVMTVHIGMQCNITNQTDILKLRMRTQNNSETANCSGELSDFISSLPANTVDAVIGGHVHDIIHTWINGVPILVGQDYAQYFNLLYFTYDKVNKKIVNSTIEGPIPVCSKLFSQSLICDVYPGNVNSSLGNLTQFTFHNITINEDRIYSRNIANYSQQAKVLGQRVLGYVANPMSRTSTGESPMGDFICDAMLNFTKADISIVNPFSIRASWEQGNLTFQKLYETDPFDDGCSTIIMNGSELITAMGILQAGQYGFYQTSGLQQVATINPRKLLSVQLYNGSQIINSTNYTVATSQYLLGGGDDFHTVLQNYTIKNEVKYGNTRNIIETAIETVKVLNPTDHPIMNPNHLRLTVQSSLD